MTKGVAVFFLTLGLCLVNYRAGFLSGRHDTIHQLFSGEKDFKQYLMYRRQQMEDRHEG